MNESARLAAPTPPPSQNYEFGSAVAADGDHALATGGISVFAVSLPGTVHALRRVAGEWSITQTIVSPDASNSDQFGASLAISGNWAIIGAPQEDPNAVSNCGAAYLYGWDGLQWTFHSRITPNDIVANKQFARAVDIDGDIVVAGAVGDIEGGNASAGAAYVFRYNGSAWVQEQKLMEQAPAPQRRLGAAVAVDDGVILVSSVPSGGSPSNTEGVYVFTHDGAAWQEQQRVQSPVWPTYEGFGAVVRLDGQRFAAGAVPGSGVGQVRLFEFNGVEWTHDQTVAGPPVTLDGQFGRAFDLAGDILVVGAPFRDAPSYPNDITSWTAGLGFVFERQPSGDWTLQWTARTRPRFNSDTLFYDNRDDRLGSAVAIVGDEFILGATTPNSSNVDEFGYVAVFAIEPDDCDANGTPDVCDPDCDQNDAVDACEIAANPALDCDSNGQIDACQTPAQYVIDDGFGSTVWGAGVTALDLIWLNQFTVTAGGQRITHIAVPWTLYLATGTPATLLVYDDPNNDGDPHDAVLLSATEVTSTEPDLGLGTGFTIFSVNPADVGEPGDSFFVGVKTSLVVGQYAAVADNIPNPGNRAWRISAPLGQANLIDLSANPNFAAHGMVWVLRGMGLDCNGNGIWDDCDINGGFSLDANGNGIPDECDLPCLGDIDGDRSVEVDDLLAVINGWGLCAKPPPAYCAGDLAPTTGGNGVVNVDDLLVVINAWGACD